MTFFPDGLLLQPDGRARDRPGAVLGGDAAAAGRLQDVHRGRGGQEGHCQGSGGKRVPQVSQTKAILVTVTTLGNQKSATVSDGHSYHK